MMEQAVQEMDAVLYLYGFVDPNTSVAGLRPVEDGCDIIVVGIDDVACAASLVPAHEYQRLTATGTSAEQIDWVAPRAWRHHEILRALHGRGTVVPLKFGTLCSTLDGIQAILRRLRTPIGELLDQFRDKDEWTLRTLVDEEALAASLQASDPGLIALGRDVAELPDGRAYFARKRLQKATGDLIDQQIDALQADLRQRLSATGWPIAPSPLSHRNGIVSADVAVLVDRSAFDAVQSLVESVESAQAASHVLFELVGPWPPYSFTGTLSVDAGAS